ncbi:MAG: hypothetical protein OXC63_06930 [Aestuariivita sp.]|nr:hypothetical protein [Aestuariivita sp.]
MKYHKDSFAKAMKRVSTGSFLDMASAVVGVTGLGRPILHPSDPDIAANPWKYVTEHLKNFCN